MSFRFLYPLVDRAGVPSLRFNGASTYINCGSDAGLDDLPARGHMTVEAWIKPASLASSVIFATKGGAYTAGPDGWSFFRGLAVLYGRIYIDHASGNPVKSGVAVQTWQHVALYYNSAAQSSRLALNGVWGSAANNPGLTYGSDAAYNLIIGRRNDPYWHYDGAMGWIRISNNDRLGGIAGTAFTPQSRAKPPDPDADTILLYKMDEGAGTSLSDSSGNGNSGTITNGTWIKD
jgi:hypothetical protein